MELAAHIDTRIEQAGNAFDLSAEQQDTASLLRRLLASNLSATSNFMRY